MANPLKYLFILSLLIVNDELLSQTNNTIFFGGDADGHSTESLINTSNNPIFIGGVKDGFDEGNLSQSTNNSIFAGGGHDGHDLNNYTASSNNTIFHGGIEDGHVVSAFVSKSNNLIYFGGTADGHVVSSYIQNSNNAIFAGGMQDGHANFGFTSRSNNDIFVGGDFDGHDVESLSMNPFPFPFEYIYVDSIANGLKDGSSWLHAFSEITEALDLANEHSNIDTILIAKGTYLPTKNTSRSSSFIFREQLHVLAGFPNGGGSFNTRLPSQNPVVLSGDIGTPSVLADNVFHVVTIPTNSSGTVLDGLHIKYGLANSGGVNRIGAGILNRGKVSFVNTFLSDNIGTATGSVIYNLGAGAELSLHNLELLVSPFGQQISILNNGGLIELSNNISVVKEED